MASRRTQAPGAIFLCAGRQGQPLFSAPAADGAVLPDKGGHRHLVAAAGRGAHSFAGACGRERGAGVAGKRGRRQADAGDPPHVRSRARPDRVPRPAGGRGREGRVRLLFPRGPRREKKRPGRARRPGPGRPAQARIHYPGPIPLPFLKFRSTGVRRVGLEHPATALVPAPGLWGQTPTPGLALALTQDPSPSPTSQP